MKKPKIQIAVGIVFSAAWLFLGGGQLYDYLSGGDTTLAGLVIGELTACCGVVWGGLQISEGCRKLKGGGK